MHGLELRVNLGGLFIVVCFVWGPLLTVLVGPCKACPLAVSLAPEFACSRGCSNNRLKWNSGCGKQEAIVVFVWY